MNFKLIEERLIKKIKDGCVYVCSDGRYLVLVVEFCELLKMVMSFEAFLYFRKTSCVMSTVFLCDVVQLI